MALGLKNLLSLDGTELAYGAIDRADQVGGCEWSRPVSKGACEEIVKACVAGNIRIGRFAHVDLVALHKPSDQSRRPLASAGAGNASGQGCQGLLRKQVLWQHGKVVRHQGLPE